MPNGEHQITDDEFEDLLPPGTPPTIVRTPTSTATRPQQVPAQGVPDDQFRQLLPSGVPLEATPPPEDEESKVKDIWDAFRLGATQMGHQAKQAFISVLPSFLFGEKAPPEPESVQYRSAIIAGLSPEEIVEQTRQTNERLRGIREAFQGKAIESEQRHLEWLKEHPELKPRKVDMNACLVL